MKEYLTIHVMGLIFGAVLDRIIGDPHSFPHPVRAIGRLISFLEKKLYREGKPGRVRGAFVWILTVIPVIFISLCLELMAINSGRIPGIMMETVFTFYILAAGSLERESMAVARKLNEKDLKGARSALSMIVGRDTGCLNEEEIIKAAVETVSENTSDGVTAPLLFLAAGGPVMGMLYKAVNTMDSMLGYRNERYEYFGFFPAIADDLFNLIPSRVTALYMIAGCFISGLFSKDYHPRDAVRIWARDRNNHSSPNAGQTESVCAGALGLQLGGMHLYRGVPVEKPLIGDEDRKPETADIKRACCLMYLTEAIALLSVILVFSCIIFLK